MKNNFLYLLPIVLFLNSCATLDTIIVRGTSGVLSKGEKIIFSETDYEKAKIAIPENISLLETFLESDPQNEQILLLLSQAYTGYALGFVEDENVERAKSLYKKGRDYGLRILMKNKNFADSWNSDEKEFYSAVKMFSREDVPALFWSANAWGNLINISIDDPNELVDLYKVNAMMEAVLEKDENYFFGSAHLYFGTIKATTPKILGGDEDGAKIHFEKSLKIGNRKFLLPFYFYAKSYAVQTQNKELFENLLNEVINAPIDLLPEQSLINIIAKKKSENLLKKINELF